jgi:16S rRNA (guanine(527)-N(7))-methyltransferase RsmG
MLPSRAEFSTAISAANFGLNSEQIANAAWFAEILHRENENQNLTRILGVSEFVSGHLLDVVELLKSPHLGLRVLDVGSGCGVPGLLAAAIDLNAARTWVLCESEGNKALFLASTAEEMELNSRVAVYPLRAEEVVETIEPDTVIARAVGKVEKIATWIANCSTWNNLILFKSTGWEAEWKEAQLNRFGKKLTLTQLYEYSSDGKYRNLVTLKRKK